MTRPPIILTTASGMGPLPTLLEQAAGFRAVENAFRRARLPIALIENTRQKIPMNCMVDLFEHAASESGDRLFGLHCGLHMAPAEYGLWTTYAAEADTLEQGIHRLVQTMSAHQTGGRLSLTSDAGDKVIWTYHPPRWLADTSQQHAHHVLPVMINFSRLYLGETWCPDWIETCYSADGAKHDLADTLNTNWRLGNSQLSIAISKTQLQTKRLGSAHRNEQPLTSFDVFAQAAVKEAQTPATVIAEIVALALLEGRTDIEYVASTVDTSVRSLQRELDASGESYRQIVDRVRLSKAKALLIETGTPVTEIAHSLGYSDSANFTRAFRRWTGKPPAALRKRRKRDVSDQNVTTEQTGRDSVS